MRTLLLQYVFMIMLIKKVVIIEKKDEDKVRENENSKIEQQVNEKVTRG